MSTAENPKRSDVEQGTTPSCQGEPDVVAEARRIGLHPTVAYIPRGVAELPDERKKRKKREKAREKRDEAQARGLHQVNIPEVPTELVVAVKEAVAAVLSGNPSPVSPTANLPQTNKVVRSNKWIIGLVLAVIALVSYLAGMTNILP